MTDPTDPFADYSRADLAATIRWAHAEARKDYKNRVGYLVVAAVAGHEIDRRVGLEPGAGGRVPPIVAAGAA